MSDWTDSANWPGLVGKRVRMVRGNGDRAVGDLAVIKEHGYDCFVIAVNGRIELKSHPTHIKSIEPTTEDTMKEFKKGCTCVIEGVTWTRDDIDKDGTFPWWREGYAIRLSDEQIRVIGATVTPPPQVPVVAEFHVPDGKYLGKNLPENFKGKDCIAVLNEAVKLDTVSQAIKTENGNFKMYFDSGSGLQNDKSYRVILIEEPS